MADSHRRARARIRALRGAALAVSVLAAAGCQPRAIRGGEGTDNQQIDVPALSTTLDRADLDYMVQANLDALYASNFWIREIEGTESRPVLAIWPVQNATSEHLGDQMLMLLSSIETSLVQSGDVRVVNRERQESLAREIGIQQGAIFDPASARRLGRMLGAEYFLTGKITSVDERLAKVRRVQYKLFLQVLEIETGLVEFQNESSRTKAVKG
jgi:curli biogenesis system outer membrane secretion channel CsgG